MISKPEVILFLDDHHGQYIPREFAECVVRDKVHGVTAEQWAILEKGPLNGCLSDEGGLEDYWDVWDEVLNSATVIDGETTYWLNQDGCLWLVPEGMSWNEKTECYEWPIEEEDEEEATE